MIRAKVCLLAEAVYIDRDTNEVSVFNLIETIQAAGFPVFMRRLTFFCLFEREPNDPAQNTVQFSIELNGRTVTSQEQNLGFADETRARNLMRVLGVVLSDPGQLVFRYKLGDTVLAEHVITVSLLPQPVAEPANPPPPN